VDLRVIMRVVVRVTMRSKVSARSRDGDSTTPISSRRHSTTPSAAKRWRQVAHLLPNYDEYFVGFKDRSAFAGRLGGTVTQSRFDALMGHVVFVNGEIVGGWRRTLGAAVELELQLLVRLKGPERVLVQRAARRFGEFLGLPVRVRGWNV